MISETGVDRERFIRRQRSGKGVVRSFLEAVFVSALSLCVLTLASCSPEEVSNGSQGEGLIKSRAGWPKLNFSVCWKAQDARIFPEADVAMRAAIRRAIEEEFEARTTFTFEGWDRTCKGAGDADITLQFIKNRASYANIGYQGPRSNNVYFYYDFTTVDAKKWKTCLDSERRPWCVRNISIHEFGHVLGLMHESDHSKSDCANKTGSVGKEIGPFNRDSIMNYCNSLYWKEGFRLSPGDFTALKVLHPKLEARDTTLIEAAQ